MEILQNFIAREREQMSWKRREVSAMMTATTRRYLLLRHLSSSYTSGKGGGGHALIGRGFWRSQYHHQCASFTKSAFPVVSREGLVFWRGFAARSSTNTARDGGRNQAFSSASSVLSSNRSASSSSGGETDDDSDDENKNYSEREKEEQKRGLLLREEGTSETSSSSSVTNKIVNIPNALSVGRAVSGPIISYMIIQGPDVYSSELVLTSIALAGISDYADGYLARRWNQTSNFGSFFDAAADKIFVSSVGVGMAATGQLPAWIVGLFVLRDCGFLASGFWRRANALKFENLTWRQYFAIDTVKREDEREDNGVVEESGRGESSSSVENSDTSRVATEKKKSDWEAFNSTEKWEPLFVGKVATALQMGLLAVACGQTLDHIPLLFDTYETQKQVISTTTENFAHFTFAATAYATAHYAKAYFSHPGWKELKQKREERREERRDYVRASVRDIRDSAKTKYRVSKEKILQRVAKSETDFRQRRQSLKRHRQHQHQQQQETTT